MTAVLAVLDHLVAPATRVVVDLFEALVLLVVLGVLEVVGFLHSLQAIQLLNPRASAVHM